MIWRNTFVNDWGTFGFGQGCYTRKIETPDPVAYAIETGAVGFIAYADTGPGGVYDVRGATFEASQDDVRDFVYGFNDGDQCDVIDGTLTFGTGNKSIPGAYGFRGLVAGSVAGRDWVFFYGGELSEQEKTIQGNAWGVNSVGGGGGGEPAQYLKTIAKTVGANSEDIYTVTDQSGTETNIPTTRYYLKSGQVEIDDEVGTASLSVDGVVDGEDASSTLGTVTLWKSGSTHNIRIENTAGDTIEDSWTEGGGSGGGGALANVFDPNALVCYSSGWTGVSPTYGYFSIVTNVLPIRNHAYFVTVYSAANHAICGSAFFVASGVRQVVPIICPDPAGVTGGEGLSGTDISSKSAIFDLDCYPGQSWQMTYEGGSGVTETPDKVCFAVYDLGAPVIPIPPL